jgi:hypothetical protein
VLEHLRVEFVVAVQIGDERSSHRAKRRRERARHRIAGERPKPRLECRELGERRALPLVGFVNGDEQLPLAHGLPPYRVDRAGEGRAVAGRREDDRNAG